MKHFIKFLFFHIIFLFFTFLYTQEFEQDNFLKYQKFFREYKFKIYRSKKEVGFINVKISSCIYSESETCKRNFVAEIESYTDIPILFFIGETYNYEIENYDDNFVPLNSKIVTKEKKSEYITTMQTEKFFKNKYKCVFRKENKKIKIKETSFSPPIITAGNAIPLVTILWNFEKEKNKKFYFIDKDKLEIKEMKFEYLGEIKDEFYKIKLLLPYFGARFVIYLDKNKDIKYAEGLGLRICAVE